MPAASSAMACFIFVCQLSQSVPPEYRWWLTALQKNVMYDFPTTDKAANTKPKRPCVASLATFSTSVKALSASARLDEAHISVMTPLAAGALPEANGSTKAAGCHSAVSSVISMQQCRISHLGRCAISPSQKQPAWSRIRRGRGSISERRGRSRYPLLPCLARASQAPLPHDCRWVPQVLPA